MMAEIDGGYQAMLRTRADGQENPGMKLLEEYNIRILEILDGNPWTNISQRMMEEKFRELRITVTLETAKQAANRHREAVTNRTHGTQLLLRRQHEDPDYEIREYWALIEDDSGPRLLGMINNSPFIGITGMEVFGEFITPGQVVWNVCYNAESLPYMEEPTLPEPTLPEPESQGEAEETQENAGNLHLAAEEKPAQRHRPGPHHPGQSGDMGRIPKSKGEHHRPEGRTRHDSIQQQDAQPHGPGRPQSTHEQRTGMHLHRHTQRHRHDTLLHALTPGDETQNGDHRVLPRGDDAPGIHPDAPRPAGNRAGAARIAERQLDHVIGNRLKKIPGT